MSGCKLRAVAYLGKRNIDRKMFDFSRRKNSYHVSAFKDEQVKVCHTNC